MTFNDLPVWQRRGVGVYWREYQKMGHNSITGEDIPTTRREVFADYDLPKGFVPTADDTKFNKQFVLIK